MLPKVTVAWCMVALLVVMQTIPPTDAFGYDLLEQLSELLFGSDESSEEMDMIINTKPNATITVVCTTGCDLNVMCVNCTNLSSTMVSPSGNGNGNGNGATSNGSGNGGSSGSGTGNGSNGQGQGGTGTANGPTTPMPEVTTAATTAAPRSRQ